MECVGQRFRATVVVDVCVSLPRVPAVALHRNSCEWRKRLPDVPAEGIDFERRRIRDNRLHDDPAAYPARYRYADLVEGYLQAAILAPCQGAWSDDEVVAVSRQLGLTAFRHGPAVAATAI